MISQTGDNNILQLQNIRRAFAVRRSLLDARPASMWAVNDVSLNVRQGETLGLVGESGCGKSTLARMAVGLLPPSSGKILLEGRDLRDWTQSELAQIVQMVFQDPFSSLNPRLKVGASIAEPYTLGRKRMGQKPTRSETRAEVEKMLCRVGLNAEHYDRYPHEFSGGQRQRVAVARSMIARPRLLVCDEPVSALDASVQAQVLNLFKDMQAELGLTYLFISHDLGVVGFMSDRVAVMYLGQIVELAEREILFQQAAHPYTQALLASAPVRDPAKRMEGKPLPGELPSPLNLPPGCAFHPRCPYVRDICKSHAPPWQEMTKAQQVRCHFPLVG